jgi:hypothetical protein
MWGGAASVGPPAIEKTRNLGVDRGPSTQPSWRPAFDAVYTLKNGETIRNIRPPYISQRIGFIQDIYSPSHVDDPNHGNGTVADLKVEDTKPPVAFFIQWDPATHRVERWTRSNDHFWRLESLMVNLVGLSPDETMVPDALGAMNIPGDWVVQKGATIDEKLKAFQQICRGTPAAFTAQQETISRDMIVAHGTYHKGDAPEDLISVKLDTDKGRERQAGDVRFYFRMIGDALHRPVVNEWVGCEDVRIEFTSPKVYLSHLSPEEAEQKIDMVLDQIGSQLGIQVTAQRRSVLTWVFKQRIQ